MNQIIPVKLPCIESHVKALRSEKRSQNIQNCEQMKKSFQRTSSTQWPTLALANVPHPRTHLQCLNKRLCHSQIQIKQETKHINDYRQNESRKLQNQRLNKYQSSYRIGGKRKVIGIESVKQKVPGHLMPRYESMMHSLHCRNWEEALSTLRSITEQDPTAHNLVLYTVAIRSCCVSGQMDEATKLYHQMFDIHHIRPDEVTLIAMLKGCSVRRDWKLSQFWTDRILKDGDLNPQSTLSVAAYSLMISSADEMTWNAAWSLFQDIRKMDHLELDIIAFNSMLDTLARAKQTTLCQELFMEIRDDPQWSPMVNGRTFEAVIRSCVPNGDLSAALHYIKMVQSKEFGALKVTKQMVSDLLRTVKNYDGEEDVFGLAVALWNQVIGPKPKPIYPDAVLFGIMIDLCSKYKDLTFALKLFGEMVTVYNVQPTVIVFNNLLKCAVAADSNDNAPKQKEWYLQIISDMASVYGEEPDQFTFNIVLNAVIQSARYRLMQDLDENGKYMVITELLTFWSTEMELKNEVSFSTMIHALSTMKREHFGDKKDILYRQLLALYESGCAEGYLGHWARTDERPDGLLTLEMHGWSVQMAYVAMQYFLDKELPLIFAKENAFECDVLISVGKGKHSQNNTAKIRDSLLPLLRDSLGLIQTAICEENDGCLIVPKSDLLLYLQRQTLESRPH